MIAAKAFFTVTAGIIPEQAMSEYTRQWGYTSLNLEQDRKVPPDEPTTFVALRDAALSHARDAINPDAVNWVRLEFVWV